MKKKVTNKIRFPRGHAVWSYVERPDGSVVNPYVNGPFVELIIIPVGSVGTIVATFMIEHEKQYRVSIPGLVDVVISPSRDSLCYRRVYETDEESK